jgi:hypothetical protein
MEIEFRDPASQEKWKELVKMNRYFNKTGENIAFRLY